MKFFPSRTVVLSLGPLSITWYALLIITGALIAYLFSKQRMIKRGYPDFPFSDFFINVLFIGIIGARIWYVIFMYQELYAANPIDIFKIYEGGLAIQGGVIAALIYSVYYMKKHNVDILKAGDAIMPTVLIAQALGRWGNFVNQEAFGQIISEEQINALHLPEFIKDGMYIGGAYRQPTFLYESVLNILGFILIAYVLSRFLKKDGCQFAMYFIWYGITRFIVESFRSDSLMLGSLKMAQVTSVAFIIIGVAGIIYIYHSSKKLQK